MSRLQFASVLTVLMLLVTGPVAAVNVYECEDANGNKSFQDRCPPGTRPVNERNYSTATPDPGTTARAPLTLYLIPNCDTCNQLREFLDIRGVRYSVKDVSTELALQDELKDLAGELQVPVLLVGEKVLTGYNRGVLIQTLTDSGHITADSE